MASSTEAVSTPAIAAHPVRARLLLGALGVVFGDIGTSPIYAFRESLKATGGASEAAVFGVVSLVFSLRLHPEALECDPGEASFFLGRETPVPSMRPELSEIGRAHV